MMCKCNLKCKLNVRCLKTKIFKSNVYGKKSPSPISITPEKYSMLGCFLSDVRLISLISITLVYN